MAQVISGLEYRYRTKCFSLFTHRVFIEDGKEFTTGEHGAGYMPDQMDELIQEIGEKNVAEIEFIRAKWTPEVVEAYKEFRRQSDREFNGE